MIANYPKNTRTYLPRVPPLSVDPAKIDIHKDEAPIPICENPITKDEYIAFMEAIRHEPEFDRLPMCAWGYEHFPEFAETPEQIAQINAEWTDETLRAKEKDDLEAEKQALEKRIIRLKKMAKKNRAIKTAKKRMLDIMARQEEMKIQDDEMDIKINTTS